MPARLNTSHTFLTRWGIHSLKLCMCCAIPEISSASVCVKGQCVRGKRGKPMLRGQNIAVLKGLLGWAGYMFYQHFAKQQITPVQHACHSREIRKSSEAKNQQSIYNRKKMRLTSMPWRKQKLIARAFSVFGLCCTHCICGPLKKFLNWSLFNLTESHQSSICPWLCCILLNFASSLACRLNK